MSDFHDFLPKCRTFYVVLEKGHGDGKKGHGAREKKEWRDTMLKLARGNTTEKKQKLIFKTDYRLMQVKMGAFCNTFDLHQATICH